MTELLERKHAQNTANGSPKYVALAALLRGRIQQGELIAGDRLPSFVELRSQYGATPTTAERVYGLLEREGLVERRQGSGTYVIELQRVSTGNIGFIGGALLNTQENPFNAHLMAGVQQAIGAQQRHLLYMGTDYSLNLAACEKVDGALICNIEDTRSIVQQLPAHLPRISLFNIADGMTSVVADDYAGARLAVRHLLDLGHRRIACLMEEKPSLAQRRFAGYCDALLEAGIHPNPQWTRLTGTVGKATGREQPYLEWARLQMSAWLQDGWKESGCTAILVQNEVAAIGVMQILQEGGFDVPEQVSVIGFDGTEICDLVSPRLCAVEVPLAKVGTTAVQVLERQIQGEQPESQVIVLPMSLRAGASVASPP